MKRESYLFDGIVNKENIYKAILRSSKGKTKRREVQKILNNIDYYTNEIYKILSSKSYIPSEYRVSIIYDSLNKKERTISKPKYYPDQVIQYCLMNILEPILIRKMYLYSCGSIKGRGTSFGKKNLRKWLDKDIRGTKYCLKMDVRKFYPSINKERLKDKFRKIIKDENCLWLINVIIDSHKNGIPLGNYTSGFFSNYYLTDLDNFIKENLKIKYYVRYVDDLVILHSNKKYLREALSKINLFLNNEDLVLKYNYQIFNIKERDIDFLGYRFFRDKTILRKRNMIRISRRSKRIYKKDKVHFKDACAIVSYYGWIKNSDSYKFYNNYISNYVSINKMKKIISEHTKNNQVI